MRPEEQATALLGAIHLLSEIRDELYAKELHGAGDDVVRCQSNLRRQLLAHNEEHHGSAQRRADERMRDLGYYPR